MYEPLIPINGVLVCAVSLIIYFKERRKNMYKPIDWQALQERYIMQCKKNVSKRLKNVHLQHLPIGTNKMPKVQRSYVVHVATTSDNKKIYIHKHNI